ncbi:MAG: hypothetical protein M1491_00070 [Deltaproteobacteria bacterium]|nr:hypothetical protein [Deltaproteobacteria bacterium]MCL5276987.1 hypothetical protein [Deltaproteobacteria bacterium]
MKNDPLLLTVRAMITAPLFFIALFPKSLAALGRPAPLSFVADTKGLSGPMLWYANLYNANKLYCALFTVIVLPIAGFILATIADVVIGKIGLDLKSRSH